MTIHAPWRTLLIVPMVLLAIGLFAACGDGDDDGDSPTSTPTSEPTTPPARPTEATATPTKPPATGTLTPTPEANTPAGFKAALQAFNKEISAGTVDPIIARLNVKEYTCTEADTKPGLGQPECSTAAEKIRAILVSGWKSEGGLRKVEGVVANLKERQAGFDTAQSDKYGPGTFRVYAYDPTKNIAVLTVTSKCLPQYNCSTFQRLTWVAQFEFVDGRWKISSLMTAFVLGEDFLEPSAEGKQRMPGWEKFQ